LDNRPVVVDGRDLRESIVELQDLAAGRATDRTARGAS